MRHFFYAIYVFFYTGAVFMAGMFVGQMMEKARVSRMKTSLSAASESMRGPKTVVSISHRKVSITGKGE
jgi:hypothetical protein